MSDNELFRIESKDTARKKDENEDFENADYQYETPHWETEFVKMIEQMRTIPYVSLGYFRFATVNWVDEKLQDDAPIVERTVVEKDKQPNHWELVKKILFSQGAKSVKSTEKLAKASRKRRQKTSPERSSSLSSLAGRVASQSQAKRAEQSGGGVFGYFRYFMQNRKLSEAKESDKEDQSPGEEESDKLRPAKRSLSFQRTKNLLRQKMNLRKILTREKGRKMGLLSGEKSKRLASKGSDKKRATKRVPDKRRDFLFDLNEMSKRKRFQKLNLLMSKDDGPFLTDYRFLLGIEFWANYCGVEKHQLISVCSNDFWSKEMTSFAPGKPTDATTAKLKGQQSESGKERNLLLELKQFIRGTDKPGKAPQRVISSEEKFRQPLFFSFFATQSIPRKLLFQ